MANCKFHVSAIFLISFPCDYKKFNDKWTTTSDYRIFFKAKIFIKLFRTKSLQLYIYIYSCKILSKRNIPFYKLILCFLVKYSREKKNKKHSNEFFSVEKVVIKMHVQKFVNDLKRK